VLIFSSQLNTLISFNLETIVGQELYMWLEIFTCIMFKKKVTNVFRSDEISEIKMNQTENAKQAKKLK
jgi:hypothetical protein